MRLTHSDGGMWLEMGQQLESHKEQDRKRQNIDQKESIL